MLQTLKNYYHLIQGVVAVSFRMNPTRGMTVIGVTGTDGKTTTSSLIYHILTKIGYKVALISTIGAYIDGKKLDTGLHVSTPNSFQLQRYITLAKEKGVTHIILEVTSHAIDQHRIYGIPFDIGVVTNITREHLDYHKSMKRYMETKAKLLQKSRVAILNKDDGSYIFLKQRLAGHRIITYGLEDAEVTPKNHPFKQKHVGLFHTYNSLAALSVCDEIGVDPKAAAEALESFNLPEGRSEVVYRNGFTIIIDFAHTPQAIESVLSAINAQKKGGRLIHVFGCAGERDKGKRPLMGSASAKYADCIILTSEDPRSEDANEIANEIRKGVPDGKDVITEIDRGKAIEKAISKAKKGDVIIVTGKGHEKSINFGKGEIGWSEHKAVENALLSQGIVKK
ncbi:MAG: UDP-N-acetylmuramoyl-L-alanyl-D-glutamate--2,6-diaminopimelate ligase [Candidatus Levybacteria bacterium]|nr:UDP-N-acetylmuramoyl-L-alanyl-D-glutamate--2,6-diaminopimelate ligase [Candidatus Levybacteria bacterium]